MRIGYLCPYNQLGCGESEARMRYTYVLEKLGHDVIALDREGYTFDTKIHGDNLNLDFVISHAVIEQKDVVYPDVFALFFFWCPLIHFHPQMIGDYLLYMNKHDAVVGGYDSKYSMYDLQTVEYFDNKSLLPCYASVPKDYVIEPHKGFKKLFYVGMGKRHMELINYLQTRNLIDIYGPKEAFGKDVWKNVPAYKGPIAYDGKEIIKKMNESGIVLAFHSKAHNSQGYVSNRIFEAAAAGAIIIADDNPFIKKYFKDSVYYIDIYKPEDEQRKDLIKILDEIENNPDKAYQKAKEAQQIFIDNLALDSQVEKCIKFVEEEKERLTNINYGTIDIICYIEKKVDITTIQEELKRQTYKNYNLIYITDNNELSNDDITYGFTFGEAFYNSINKLKGNYFSFMCANNIAHKHHLFKNLDILNKNKSKMFSYTGIYQQIKKDNNVEKYETLNCNRIDFSNCIFEIKTGLADKAIVLDLEKSLCENSVVFNKKIIDYINNGTICLYNTKHLHLYLMLLSLMLDINNGIYTHTISAGIKEKEKQEVYYNAMNKTNERFYINIKKSFIKYQINDSNHEIMVQYNINIAKKHLKQLKKKLLSYKITHLHPLFSSKKAKNKINEKIKEINKIKEKYNI